MERRQAVRVPWVTGVECEEVDTGVRHVGAQLSDISLSGVFVYGVPVLSEGTRLRLRFTLPSLQMQVDAAVVHTTPAGGMGLAFQDLTPVHRVVIQELMRPDAGDSPAGPVDSDDALAPWEAAAGSLDTVQLRLPVTEEVESLVPEPESPPPVEEEAAPGPVGAGEPSPPEPEAASPEVAADPEPETTGEGIDDVWPPPLPPLPELSPAEPAEPPPADAATVPATPDLAPEPPAPPADADASAPETGAEGAPPPAGAEEEAPERPRRVLIVDDHDRTRVMLRGMIEGREKAFAVTEAVDGEDCLRVVDAEGPFDLIFLDVDMPRLDGLDACRELRARGVRAPIIFLTGRSELGDFRAGREAGADTYIKKPIVLGTLRSMLGLFTSGSLQRR